MIKNITYEDKASIQNDESVARKNKVTDTDMNEIKEVVNANADGQITMQKDITNIKAKDTEQDSKIVELQTEKAELEKELKEAQEDFYQNSIRGQASGEYIHVEDSSNCRANLQISGNSRQEVVTDNLFNNTWRQGIIASETGVEIDSTENIRSSSVEVHASHLYSISRSIYTSYMSFRFYTKDGVYLGNQLTEGIMTASNADKRMNANESSMTFTITNANVARMRIVDNSNNLTTKYTLTTDTINPDYPAEIKTVGSNVNLIEETFKGYNLNANGAFEISSSFNMQIAKVKANVIYTLNTKTNVLGYYNEKPTLTSVTYNKSRTVLPGDANTIVATRDGYIAIRTMDAEKVKCVEGTEVGEYSKHGQGCVKVTKCNKNLFDKNTTIDGKYIGSNGSIQTQSNIMYSDYIQIKTNINYYITGRSEWSSVVLYDKNKTFLERISTTQPNGVLNITNSNCKYIIINALLTNKDTLQLEEGASTSYEPHKEQSYIMPTQREILEGDYFDFDNEEEVHTWNKLVLNGTEDWTYNSIENLFYIILENSDLSVSSNIHCTHFKSVLYNVVSNENNCITANGIMLMLKKNDISNLEDYISYLKSQYDAGTPVTIYYKLATPTRLPFTEEQKAVAKKLNNARTYKNVTNITTDSKAILDLDYAKDLETLLNNTQALAVNNASEGV